MGSSSKRIAHSLFHRMAVALATTILVISTITAALTYIFILSEVSDLQDDQLQQIAQLPGVETWMQSSVSPISLSGDAQDEDDTPVYVFQVAPRTLQPTAIQVPLSMANGTHTVRSQDKEWRIYLRTLDDGRKIAVAQDTDARDELAHQVMWGTLLPLLGAIPALILMTALVVRFFLKDTALLAAQLDEKGDANLSPLTEDEVPAEILPFVQSINRLLRRLSSVLDHQRRFVADAAHELRTPVAALTLQVENLAHAAISDDARRRIKPVLEGLRRMRKLLEQLLELARLQSQASRPESEFEPTPVIKEVIADLMPLVEAKHINLEIARMDPDRMHGRAEDLATIVRNGLANAIVYTPDQGRIVLNLYIDANNTTVLEIRDSGPGLSQSSLEMAFNPFYRALGTSEPGSGLGLALVKSAATRLGGDVSLSNIPVGDGGGLNLTFRQPAQLN